MLIYWWHIFENGRIDSKEVKIKVRIMNKNVGRGLLSRFINRQLKLH